MKQEKFEYVYHAPSAEERKMIESIRRDYLPMEEQESKLQLLRSLDRRVHTLPRVVALTLGVCGTLIFGAGMSMVLVWELWVWGILVALGGVIVALLAYPVHRVLLARGKKKYGERIVLLSNELLGEKQ